MTGVISGTQLALPDALAGPHAPGRAALVPVKPCQDLRDELRVGRAAAHPPPAPCPDPAAASAAYLRWEKGNGTELPALPWYGARGIRVLRPRASEPTTKIAPAASPGAI